MQWEKLYYIGCDAEQSGIMQGEIVADYIKNHPEVDKNQDGKIQYILLEGEAGHQMPSAEQTIRLRPCLNRRLILKN